MPFKPGTPRPPNAGRKKGSKNLKRLLKAAEVLANANINPVEEILKILPDLKPEARAKILLELHRYVEAPVKASEPEPTQHPEQPSDLPTENLVSLVKA